MVIDKLENLPKYFSLHPDMEAVHGFLKEFCDYPDELRRYDLNDQGLFVNVEAYITKPAEGRDAEAHRKYADLQIVILGQEQIGIAPLDTAEPSGSFSEAHDIGFYTCEFTQWAQLRAGWFALIWPHEVHLPRTILDGACNVIKAVAKLPLQ